MSELDEPVGLDDALAAVSRELGLPQNDVHARLEARWVDVVGDDVASRARLVAVREGVATIVVDSPPWATQLRFLELELVARANAVVGEPAVRAITVRIEPFGAAN